MKWEVTGLHEMIQLVENLTKPSFRAVHALEQTLHDAFQDTQSRVHVITGSLKASGKTESSFDGRYWEGSISYGGSSSGPKNPVIYAGYELARGGSHDFYAGLPEFYDNFDEALAEQFNV